MAATLRIDTLKFAKRLTDAGLSREAAEAIAEGISEADTSDLATKTDLLALKGDLTAEITDVRTEMAGIRTAIADLRADFYGRLWIMGAGIVGLTVALIKVLPG